MTDRSFPEIADAFWTFSTTFYARPGVEPALLGLQDRDGLEVNLALFCLFAAAEGRQFDLAAIEAMRAVGLAWGREVVAPLRHARRVMKPIALGNDIAAGLRDEVKALELASEKAMQGALVDLLATLPAGSGASEARDRAAINFAGWFAAEGIDSEDVQDAVVALIDAAFSG